MSFERVEIGGATLVLGDCLEVLRTLPDQSVHCCVTSMKSAPADTTRPTSQSGAMPKPVLMRSEERTMQYDFHPLADIFPLVQGQEYQDLVADVAKQGVREPIWLYEGKILDGRNRYRAAKDAGQPITVREFTGDDPVGFVVSLNLHRRHLTESQRAMVAAKLANMQRHDNQHTRGSANLQNQPVSQSDAAQLLNVSTRTVAAAAKVRNDGVPELTAAVESGRVSVSAASTVAEVEKDRQIEIVARGEKEILEAAKAIRSERAAARRAELEKIKEMAPPLPDGRYETIVIDPPWEMQKIERDVRPNQVAFDYPTMTEEELARFGVPEMAADDCHLFCWTTHKHLPVALRLLEAWGFRYVCTMVWHKPGGFQPIGLPQYNCEFVLYARKGSPRFIDTKAFNCCFEAPRREHSRKPDEFYDVVRRVAGGPRIDVFSRESRDGFDTYGNEEGKFDGVA